MINSILLFVTCDDISVIYVTAQMKKKLKLYLWSGSQRHRHFAGFFNVPRPTPTRDQTFYTVIPTHRPLVTFYDTLGIQRMYSPLKPPAPSRGIKKCLISFATAPLTCSERGGSEKFKMKIYVSSEIRTHTTPVHNGRVGALDHSATRA